MNFISMLMPVNTPKGITTQIVMDIDMNFISMFISVNTPKGSTTQIDMDINMNVISFCTISTGISSDMKFDSVPTVFWL